MQWAPPHPPCRSGSPPHSAQAAALRALAVLGENDLVERAVGRPPIKGRGLRILSMGGCLGLCCALLCYGQARGICLQPCLWHEWRPVSRLCSPTDGGGMKGMATVRLLRELERHTGKAVWELFDLIGAREGQAYGAGRWHGVGPPVAAHYGRWLTAPASAPPCRPLLQSAPARAACWRWRWGCGA